jgi:hypothetical protein
MKEEEDMELEGRVTENMSVNESKVTNRRMSLGKARA